MRGQRASGPWSGRQRLHCDLGVRVETELFGNHIMDIGQAKGLYRSLGHGIESEARSEPIGE